MTTWLDYLAKTWGGMTPDLRPSDFISGGIVSECGKFSIIACAYDGDQKGIISLANLRDEILELVRAADAYFEGRQRYNIEGYQKHDAVLDALTALREAAEKQGEKG